MLEMVTAVTVIAGRFRLLPTGPVTPRPRATLTLSPLNLRIQTW
jgi:hypothetical protein